MRLALALLLLLLLLLIPVEGDAGEPARLAPTRDGIEIRGDVALEAGTWTVVDRDGAGVIRIREDGVTLDLGGATLAGAPRAAAASELMGVGILVEGAEGVTIRNGSISGFKIGIRAIDATGLVIEGVDATGNYKQRLGSTPEAEDAADWLWPHHNDENEWESRYGAGFSLTNCEGATVRRCRVRHGQNGLLLTRCTRCFAYDNDFSFNSGWGVALYRTTHTEVSHNRLDFCVRGYSHDVYHRGQDSAAILVFEQSSHNLFVRNSATHSGDGFFLYAGHETTQRTGRGGSNHNRVIGNDFRFAVANGIEATFSTGNVFALNDCSGSDYGIWAGYSYASQFHFNRIHACSRAGIAIEHGHDNSILANDIRGGRDGIHLWWDEDPDFVGGIYGREQDCASARNGIHWNTVEADRAALRLERDVDSRVTYGHFPGPVTSLQLLAGTRGTDLRHNAFLGDLVIRNGTGREITLPDTNRAQGALRTEGDPVRFVPGAPTPPVNPIPPPEIPAVRGSHAVALPEALPAGRASMRVDEWGPVDPRETRLFPATQQATGSVARIFLLGSTEYRVTATSAGISVTPRAGVAPATIEVRAEGDGPAIVSFDVRLVADDREHRASGTLLRIPWDVRWFAWSDAADPTERPTAFQRLLAGEPASRETFDAIDFEWKGAGPAGMDSDRFATLATARPHLPPGRYRMRVTSDDGVRLLVDGEQVLERWDRHGPTEDVVELDLEGGVHELRLEHFEIDGWAWLAFRLEPLD